MFSALTAAGEGPGRAPHLVSEASTRPRPSPWPAVLPGAGRPSQGETRLQPGRGPENLISSLGPAPGRANAAGGGEVAARTSCHHRLDRVRRKSFLDKGRRVLLTQEVGGFSGSGTGGAELGPRSRGEKNPFGRSRAPQLSAGTAGPAPAAQPPPPLSPFLLPPPQPPRPGRQAPGARGRTDRVGVASERASTLRPLPPPAAPFFSPPGPGLRREGAGGRRQRRAEEEKESKERTVPGEKPAPAAAASPLPPSRPANTEMAEAAAKGSAGSPAPLGAPNRQPLARGESSGAAAAGSISARSPRVELPAGPAPSRRVGMRGRAPGAQSQRAACPARPASASLRAAVGRPQVAFVTREGGSQQPAFRRGSAVSPLPFSQVSCP